jgi:hypothetical protein
MKKIILLSFILIAKFNASAQSEKKITKFNHCKELENTYQIISHQSRNKLAITSEVCEIVKRERKKDETIIYKVNDFYSIKIYSEKELLNIKKPLEYIIYKEN